MSDSANRRPWTPEEQRGIDAAKRSARLVRPTTSREDMRAYAANWYDKDGNPREATEEELREAEQSVPMASTYRERHWREVMRSRAVDEALLKYHPEWNFDRTALSRWADDGGRP